MDDSDSGLVCLGKNSHRESHWNKQLESSEFLYPLKATVIKVGSATDSQGVHEMQCYIIAIMLKRVLSGFAHYQFECNDYWNSHIVVACRNIKTLAPKHSRPK